MELLFESRTNLSNYSGHLNFVQHTPRIHPEPVVVGDTFADGKGLSIYGTVLRDGGRLRMWYLAMPEDWDYKADMSSTAYAESDDGIHWTKPALKLVKHGPGPNNLVNISLHCPSVFIDPDSPPSHRYRATGCGYKGLFMGHPDITEPGYYTAHSADGISWQLDAVRPRWRSSDVITSIYHHDQRRGIIAMKFTPRVNRIMRRSIHTAEFKNGVYSEAVSALYADEFDDVCAVARGHSSCDYYGMGMQGAGSGTVGFLWNFWHDLPYTGEARFALYGTSDVTLVYQPDRGGRWFHVPGRPTFIDHTAQPWMDGWINTASCPVEMGDEHWLYFSGVPISHGFYLDERWQRRDRWTEWTTRHGRSGITFARWPRWRLFGFQADPEGSFTIDLGRLEKPSELALNYKTRADGQVRVQLLDGQGKVLKSSMPLTGDATEGRVAWPDGTVIQPGGEAHTRVRVELDVATVYAYEVVPAR
jgi:hypothetical protein